MGITAPIPPRMREEMAQEPFYSKCCVTGRNDEKIEWHHNLTWKSKRVNEKFCILPLIKSVHDKLPKELCNWIMWNRASEEEITRYSKAENYHLTKQRLNEKYGTYTLGRAKKHWEYLQKSV